MQREYKKIALLCDYGLDDAIATSYLMERREAFEKIDIVPIGGNLPLETAYKNAWKLMNAAGGDLSMVRIVNTSAIPQPGKNLTRIHGADGMGDILPDTDEKPLPEIDFYEWLAGIDEEYMIFSLGPCTVAEKVMDAVPGAGLIIMGGNVSEKPNFEGREFNHALDVPAFASCVKHDHAAVTLDTSRASFLDFSGVPLKSRTLFEKLACRYRDLVMMRGRSEVWIYDLYAVYYFFHPECFDIEELTDPDGNMLSVLKYSYPDLILSV